MKGWAKPEGDLVEVEDCRALWLTEMGDVFGLTCIYSGLLSGGGQFVHLSKRSPGFWLRQLI
jgi:hypothetical protein